MYYLIVLFILALKFIYPGGRGSIRIELNTYDELLLALPILAVIAIPIVIYYLYIQKKGKEYEILHPRDETKVWDITKEIIGKDKYNNKEVENSEDKKSEE